MKTIKNKIAALAIFLASFLPILPSIMLGEKEIDCTYMLLIGVMCICLFFSKESWFYENDPTDNEVPEDKRQ